MESLIVEKEEEGKRLDKLLSDRFPDFSRTYFQYLIDKHLVLINGKIVKKRELLKESDEIEIEFVLTPEIPLEAENIPLNILYEDEDILIVNKPSGMVVHPGVGNPNHTFVNALLYHCKQLNCDALRPGIVHRLDKDTTGVLIAAKNEKMQEALVSLFAERGIEKEYLAICIGNPGNRTITTNIGRNPYKRQEMAVLEEGGKLAITHTKTLSYDERYSVVSLLLETGRTHQLRVHLKHIKTPILGDPVYGNVYLNKKLQIPRPLLHAKKVTFAHPFSKKDVTAEASIPEDMLKFL